MLHLSTYQLIPHLCILCGKWFWINVQQMNQVTFEHQINSQYLSLSIFLVHIWSFRSSLLSFPRNFSSCKLCGKYFSMDSWLKMHIIFKHQSIHKTSLSPSSSFTSGVCSESVPSCTSGGLWKTISITFLESNFSREEEHIVVFVENFFQHMAVKWAQTNHLWDPDTGGRACALPRCDGDKVKTSKVAVTKVGNVADVYLFLDKSVDVAGKALKEKDIIFL